MVNVGKAQGFFPGNLMEMVNRNVVGDKPDIGRIDLMPGYTLFDVRKQDARRVIDALRHVDFFGTRINPEIASDRDYDRDSRGKREKRRSKDSYEDFGRPSRKSRDKGEKKASKERQAKDLKAPKAPKEKKAVKEKKQTKDKKPQYNGNYEIFYKK